MPRSVAAPCPGRSGGPADPLERARELGISGLGISGLGLGLYAARGISGAHRGEVTLFSAGSGTGTTAVLRMPVEPLA